jgi:uncharacterized membrane protein YvlD (DUF360 family)
MSRFSWSLLGVACVQAVILWLLSLILPGFTLSGLKGAFIGAILIAGTLTVAWPFIYSLSARFHPILFPLIAFGLTGLVVFIVGQAGIESVQVDSFWTGVWLSVGLTMGNVLFGALFSLSDDRGYDWFVIRPLKRFYSSTPTDTEPGVLFLEIDGLAEPILRTAMEKGYMPTLQRWMNTSSHRLMTWEPDLSSQTSASQAGILLGDNSDIPAFRWYDKQAGKVLVTSNMAATSAMEQRLSSGQGLLVDGGASRWNIFSGDAPDCLCTFSAVGARKRAVSREYVAYFSNPYSFARTLALFTGDVFRERWQARSQVRRNERPRIDRRRTYALIRASTTTVMQEASRFMLISDMFRGVPVVYNTFFSYDEVAHHSGIDRPDALKVLRTLDRVFTSLEAAAAQAPRPYHLVVLSDHGQSMGATFRQRYGQTLSDLVKSLISDEHRVSGEEAPVETVGAVNVALTEAIRQDRRPVSALKRPLKPYTHEQEVDVSPVLTPTEPEPASDKANVIVLASGNLGLISFLDWKERMTYEQINDAFPDLLGSLVRHEGIAFVMVNSEAGGGIVIGPEGMYYLNHGYATGVDPLSSFGPNAAWHLSRTNSFRNAPDILVNSQYDTETGEVAAFEELVGSHGGIGGSQTQPFVLYPATFAAPGEPIVGAAALHRVLKSWRKPDEAATAGHGTEIISNA